jgi:hypothetical protein
LQRRELQLAAPPTRDQVGEDETLDHCDDKAVPVCQRRIEPRKTSYEMKLQLLPQVVGIRDGNQGSFDKSGDPVANESGGETFGQFVGEINWHKHGFFHCEWGGFFEDADASLYLPALIHENPM